jgi:hypothetical protein
MNDKQDPALLVTLAMTNDKVGRTVVAASGMTNDYCFGHASTVYPVGSALW